MARQRLEAHAVRSAASHHEAIAVGGLSSRTTKPLSFGAWQLGLGASQVWSDSPKSLAIPTK
jgi:hypothetical protein